MRFRPWQSLRGRLLLLALLVEALMLALLIGNSLRLLHTHMGEQAKIQASQIAPILNAALVAPLAQSDYATVQAVLDESRATEGIDYLAVHDASGHLVAISGWPAGEPLPPADTHFSLERSQAPARYDVVHDIRLAGQSLGSLHFGLTLDHIVAARASLLNQGLLIALGELLLSAGLLATLGLLLTRQLSVLTRASQRVAEGELTPPPVPEGSDDIGRLGTAFNAMSTAIGERVSQLTAASSQLARLAESTRQEHARLDALLAAMAFGVLFTDRDGRIAYVNRAFVTLWRLLEEPARLRQQDLAAVARRMSPLLPDGTGALDFLDKLTGHREICLRDGRTLTVEAIPVGEASAPTSGRLWVFSDVSAERMAAQQLLAAKERAEAASLAKATFLATMSHEIRTPMNGIIGMTELVLDSPLDPEQREQLELVRASTDTLLAIVNDILDFSKIEAGRMELEQIPFALHRLVEDTLGILQAGAAQRGLRLEAEVAPNLPEIVMGDPVRLRQVLTNLISNAIKFSAEGTIRVTAEGAQHADGGWDVEFAVIDNGIGIPPEKLATIFEPFTQADYSITRKYGGTGLGLAIVTHLVELMGGNIRVDSNVGHGSTFRFTVMLHSPLNAEPLRPLPGGHPRTLAPLRLLLAEDNSVNQKVALGLLQKQGHRLTAVWNGREAVDAFSAEPAAFDAILMDMQMPVMDGLEATRRIRRLGPLGAAVPVIALTANASENDRQACLAAGMNDFVSKPFRIDEINAVLGTIVPSAHLDHPPGA